MHDSLPILYTFRRCPYAIRARMALWYSQIPVRIREVALKNKPAALLAASAKGTVPVLILADGQVIEESLDIMRWALTISDPDNWLTPENQKVCQQLISTNDQTFKPLLDGYKYPQTSAKQDSNYYRQAADPILSQLESLLNHNPCLNGQSISLADVALFPFIRQFAMVDKDWFSQSAYPNLRIWLQSFLISDLFKQVMQKYPEWDEQEEPILAHPSFTFSKD